MSADRRRALVSLVTGPARANAPFAAVRPKGLDPDAMYRVNGGEAVYPGDALMRAGYPLPPQMGDYRAFQLYLEAE